MGSIISRHRGDRTYMYYVYYDNEKRRIEEYCGAKTDPKTPKKLLEKEIEETEIQISELDTKLTDLKTRLEKYDSKT